MRLSHANAQRLPYLTHHLTGDHNFWQGDPDRYVREDVLPALMMASGLSEEALREMMLPRFAGALFERLHPQGQACWVTPQAKRFYAVQRSGAVYCPRCLLDEASPYLRLTWRLSLTSICPEHRLLLRDRCPHCQAIFAPHLNDLGRGKDWSLNKHLPFGWCPHCGGHLCVDSEAADPAELAFQERLMDALRTGQMAWDSLGHVPALEGFAVLHQLLSLLFLAGPWKALEEMSGLSGQPHPRSAATGRLRTTRLKTAGCCLPDYGFWWASGQSASPRCARRPN